MDRAMWLDHKKRLAVERYDRLSAPDYDSNWGKLSPTHARFVSKLKQQLGPGSSVLDAGCGSGKYWPLLMSAAIHVEGVDQSSGMLRNLYLRFPGATA